MKKKLVYCGLMLLALSFWVPSLQARDEEQERKPNVTGEESSSREKYVHTVFPENCNRSYGFDLLSKKTQNVIFENNDIGSSFSQGMTYNEMSDIAKKEIGNLSGGVFLEQRRRCNVHLPEGSKIGLLRAHTMVGKGSIVTIAFIEKSVEFSAKADGSALEPGIKNVCQIDIFGNDLNHNPKKRIYDEYGCHNIKIDNMSNGYYLEIDQRRPQKSYPSWVRTIQIFYQPTTE